MAVLALVKPTLCKRLVMKSPRINPRREFFFATPHQVREVLASKVGNLLDVKGVSDVADCFVIASGTSDTHVRGVADHVVRQLDSEGFDVHHVEGLPQGRWVLLDFGDVVVHAQHDEERDFYDLERLWKDCPVIELPEAGLTLRIPSGALPRFGRSSIAAVRSNPGGNTIERA